MTAVAVAAASGAASDLDRISRWVVDVMEAVGAPGAGYFLGESWPLVDQYAGVLQGVVIAATAALVALFAAGKVRKAHSRVGA